MWGCPEMFTITNHARSRFMERFKIDKKQNVDALIHESIKSATLERGFMNDTQRMVWMLEKYGDFKFDYYVNAEMVFVTKNKTIITIINRNDSGMRNMFGSKSQGRFRKKISK